MVCLRADGAKEEIQADLIVGCDGAFSAIRKQFLRQSRFNFSQTYIPHGYLELTMPPINGEVGPLMLRTWHRIRSGAIFKNNLGVAVLGSVLPFR